VRSLSFRGNQAFRGSELALRISTTASSFARRTLHALGTRRCLDSDELRLDVGRLRLFYRRHGYYNTMVDTTVTPYEDGAVKLAQQSVAVITNQYKAGTVTYLNVITAQTAALSNERTAIAILGSRMADTVLLIEALGGGWNAADLPSGKG